MILSFTQALSHGFKSLMASEWIWVIFRFLQQLKKSFPGCVWPTETMWCCFSHCHQSLVPSKEDVIFFFALKLLVPTSVLSTVGGYHYVPVALTGDISQCLKQPKISNSKCISPTLASHFITTIAWLWKTNKFRTGLVLAKSWCTTPIPPTHKWWLASPSPSSDCHSLYWSWHPILLFPLCAPHFLCVIQDSNSSHSPGGGWETCHGDESVYWQKREAYILAVGNMDSTIK